MHNLDTARIRQKYIAYRELREKALKEGVPFEELKKQENIQVFEPTEKPKALKKKITKKKKAAEVCIKMKDKDGNIINFDEQEQEQEEEKEEQKAEAKIEEKVEK